MSSCRADDILAVHLAMNNTALPPPQDAPSSDARLGWVWSPNQRGTIDILWGNALVLFVCVWTVLHPNIPSKTGAQWRVIASKARWALLAVASPELLTLFAISQWNAAKISVREMKDYGDRWSIVHAFYANAGGFMLAPPDCPSFPINAASIHYLVSRGWIALPQLSRSEIWDRSKADIFAKGFAILQIGWLLLQCIARAIQGLAVTPLELFTLAFIVPTVATSYFWANKPQGVGEPTTIVIATPIAQILVAAGEAARELWLDKPMDFVEKVQYQGWGRRKWLLHFGGLRHRPLDRMPNDYIGPPSTGQSLAIWLISIVHAGVHVAGWAFPFPSRIEMWIWRGSSLTLLAFMGTGGIIPVLSTKPWFDFKFTLLWIWQRDVGNPNLPWFKEHLLNRIADISYVTYITARILIFVEIGISFRSLPASAYEAVNWTMFVPHIT